MGTSHSCAILIVFNADGTTTILSDPNSGDPYEQSDDTMIGVYNRAGVTVSDVMLTSGKKIFGFDGDGMCSKKAQNNGGKAPGCPYDTDTSHPGFDYAGPGITYSNISADFKTGVVNFAQSCSGGTTCTSTPDGLADGATVFFSLENRLTGADITIKRAVISSTKSATPDPATPGQEVTYTIKLSNTGNIAGTTDVVDDYDEAHINITDPGGGSVAGGKLTWTGVNVPVGANTVTLTYKGTVGGSFTGSHDGCGTGFPVSNSVTLTNGTGTTHTICVNAGSHITSVKSADKTSAAIGDTITYTIKLSNDGGSADTTDVVDDYDDTHLTITDPGGGTDAGGKITWTGVSVPVGPDTVTLTYKATVHGPFSGSHGDCGTGFPVANSVTLSNGVGTGKTICVDVPNITSAKSADKSSAEVGDTVTYTIKLSNSGRAAGTTDVVDDYDDAHLTITDPGGGTDAGGKLTWTGVNVPPGTDSVTLTYKATIHGPFSGSHGDCGDGFPVVNVVTLSNGGGTGHTICVTVPIVTVPIVMTGRAYGGSLSLLDSPLIDPTADTGAIATSNDSFTDECALALPVPSDPGYLVNIRVLCGTVKTTKATHTSEASASVAHVTVVLPGAPIIDVGVVDSSSTTNCSGSVGHTTIASLKLDGDDVLGLEDAIPANTVIPLGIGELRINEQIPIVGAEKGLTVNAIHLDLPGIIDLVLASSESDISGCP